MLVVMLATFASPSLGQGLMTTHIWGATDSSLATQHPSSQAATDSPASVSHDDHHRHHHDQHDGQHDDGAQHQDAHGCIGHLFSHMPIGLFGVSTVDIQPQAQPRTTFLRQPVVRMATEPPLRPPKARLS
jgi:hypothetical protein